MKSEHADMFFDNGTLRIGTLLDFKKNESFNAAIGDENEGSHFPYMHSGRELPVEAMTASQTEFVNGLITMESGCVLKNVTVVQEVCSQDFYVFCMASEPSRKAMEKFECDRCIEILNPQSFINAITRKVQRDAGELAWQGQITYMNKTYSYLNEEGIHPATTKDISYEYQKEYRAIWHAKNGTPQDTLLLPFFIKAPKAIKHCRLIRL
ncbi:hypothetical protein CUC52_11240 [Citrobacter freundii]|nr:hypothetical protein CUC52_11240 [Citrobacter freundii]